MSARDHQAGFSFQLSVWAARQRHSQIEVVRPATERRACPHRNYDAEDQRTALPADFGRGFEMAAGARRGERQRFYLSVDARKNGKRHAATLGESRRNNQTHFVSIHGIYGSSTTKSVNPSDIIAGILIQNGFIIVSEIKSELAKETVIVNYGESGRRNRRFGYTIEVTIQFISADTNQMICSCTAEGQGSTEADDIRQAIKRALDGLFAELR